MELTKYNQWVVWKTDYIEDRLTKIPVNPKTQNNASSADCETWSDYETALKVWKSRPHLYKGVGFMFTDTDLFCVIDIDDIENCSEDIKQLPEMFHTYREVSQSGKGIHIIMKAQKPGNKCRSKNHPGLEIYDRNRFVAITGKDRQGEIEDCQELLTETYNKFFGEPSHPPSVAGATATPLINRGDLDDAQLLEIAKNSKNGDLFRALWAGEDVNGDDSANDLSLCNILAFYCQGDKEQMDRLFRQSGLMREKWEKREDYRRRTLSKAVEDCREFFTPKTRTRITGDYDPEAVYNALSETEEATSNWAVPGILKSFNDVGNSDYFARKYEGKLIYSNQDWYQWTGKNWEIITDISEYVKTISDDYFSLFAEIEDDKLRKPAFKWAKETGNSGHISAIAKLAQTDRRLAYKGRMDSCSYRINCLNGVVNLKTGELTPHNPKEYWHKTVNASYSKDPEVPAYFLNFINSVMNGSKEWTDYMQKVLGYALTGDMKEQSCFWLFGEGSTGKSTLLELMDDILGDYCTVCDSDMFMSNTNSGFELIDLKNVRMAYSEESCGKKELDGSRFKAVAGGGRQKCKRKYKNSENVTFRAKLFFATNEMPSYMGDYATKRRIRLIPFRRQWTEEERDPDLPEKLRKERDGIFTWLVYGAMKYYREGLAELWEQKVLKEEQIIESDPLAFWIDQSFDRDETAFCSSKELWSWWCLYCESEHIKNGFSNSSRFMVKLKQITGLKTDKLNHTRGIKGLRLKGQ